MRGFFLDRMRVVIVSYSPQWVEKFADESGVIAKALWQLQPVIEHIGSTSIVDLAAKPIIDILVGVKLESDLNLSIEPMQSTGYTYNKAYEGMMPYRRFFQGYKHNDGLKSPVLYDVGERSPVELGFYSVTNVHLFQYGTEDWKRHIAFRDYMRVHKDIMKQYEQLKITLAQREFENIFQYNDAKNDFIQKVQSDAMNWFKANYR